MTALMILLVFIFVALGALFSGSETGVYRLSRFKMRVGIEQNKPFYRLLRSLMEDTHSLILSILIGNNIVNYIATYIVTVLFISIADSQNSAQFYATAVMTPVLFVFSEVIPKNSFYYICDSLMPALAPVLWMFHVVFKYSGLVKILEVLSKLSSGISGAGQTGAVNFRASQRKYIQEFIRESREEGILSSVQNDIMNRLVNIPDITLTTAMVPLRQAAILDVKTDRKKLKTILSTYPYSRYPVYKNSPASIIGYINIYEALTSEDDFDSLEKWVHDISRLSSDCTVPEAIEKMRKDKKKIILVTAYPSRKRRIVGIATMKDLVEELTGELEQW